VLFRSSSMKNDDSNGMRSLGYFSVVLGDLIGFTGAGVGLGFLAWKKLGAPQWVILPTSLVGLTLAFYQLYRRMLKDNQV
jgi:F0F1-type ATP synthase assembly protein I